MYIVFKPFWAFPINFLCKCFALCRLIFNPVVYKLFVTLTVSLAPSKIFTFSATFRKMFSYITGSPSDLPLLSYHILRTSLQNICSELPIVNSIVKILRLRNSITKSSPSGIYYCLCLFLLFVVFTFVTFKNIAMICYHFAIFHAQCHQLMSHLLSILIKPYSMCVNTIKDLASGHTGTYRNMNHITFVNIPFEHFSYAGSNSLFGFNTCPLSSVTNII